MQKLIIYLLLIFFLASCEEQSDWDLKPTTDDYIIVDGIITNELKTQSIILSKPVADLNAMPAHVSGATVLVSSNLGNYTFHEDAALPGKYVSDKAFAGLRNRTYSLVINYGTKVYTLSLIHI